MIIIISIEEERVASGARVAREAMATITMAVMALAGSTSPPSLNHIPCLEKRRNHLLGVVG
jgi:hypothetical protein